MYQERKNRIYFLSKNFMFVMILVISVLFLNSLTQAQVVKITYTDSIKQAEKNKKDDSVVVSSQFPVSPDRPESEIKYKAKDSLVYDAINKKLKLYNKAEISYEDIKVMADYIEYLQDSSLLTALEILSEEKDSTKEKPRIFQGQESSTFSSLFFNFKSKRALVENAYSQYGEGFILSRQVKRNNDNSISGLGNIYTTCSDPHPHFGIGAKKIKIVPGKVAVSGPANLVVEDIPTPLYLPFGLFPLKQGQRSGFKLPTYDMSDNLGFGLREGGYYFAINDHWDLMALADIYALGTWRAGFVSNYVYRYRFSGMFNFSYAYNKIGETYEPGGSISKNFMLNWSHTINPNVMPGSNLNVNVNVGSSKYQRNNTYDANLYLNNNYISNISYSKSWQNKPYNFSAALRHNQNTQTRLVLLTLPEMNFAVNQIFPFQLRKDIIKPRWYEKIGASYNFSVLNRLDFYDSVFSISNLKWKDFKNGFRHTVPINATYQVMKYFNWAFNVNYNEYWYTEKMQKGYNSIEGRLDTNINNGFFTARQFDFSTALSTRIYGIKLFKKGAIKGIRHVLTPSIRFAWQPDFGRGIFNYYYDALVDSLGTLARFSKFEGALMGAPSDGKVGGIGFDLGNTLQLKVNNKKDTTSGTRKINIIDGLNINGFYNLALDSFRWSNIRISYRNTLFQNINISGGMVYSPYAIDQNTGRLTSKYLIYEENKLLRFQSANMAIGATLPSNKNKTKSQNLSKEQKQILDRNYAAYADFNIPWTLNVNYSVTFTKTYLPQKQKDTLRVVQDINFFGDVNITSKWKIGIRSGYDFIKKEIVFTTLDIYRDLHCWEMRLNLIPFGPRKSYNFALNVKSAVLQDLKLVRRRDFRDNL